MNRRVTDGPQDEYRRQLDDLHRRTNWEHSQASEPDPDWESGGGEPTVTLRGLLDAVLRRPRGRLPRR